MDSDLPSIEDQFFNLSLDLLCIANFDGYFTRVNPQWSIILGFSAEQLLKQPFLNLVHPDDRQSTLEATESLVEGNDVVNFINRYQHKNGNYLWLEWKARSDPNTQQIFAIAKDVTQSMRRDSYLEKLGQVTGIGYWEIDLDTNNLYWSERVHEIHETDAATYKPKLEDGIAFYHKDSIGELSAAVEKQMRTGEPYDLELKFITAKGNHRWVRAASQSEVVHNKPVRIFGAFEDITEKVEKKLETTRLKERIELAYKASNIGIWDLDLVKNHLVWDERMYKIYQIDKSDFNSAYDAWSSMLHPDDKTMSERAFDEAVGGIKDFDLTFRIITPNGETRYIAAIADIIKNEYGEPIRMLGVNWDVTLQELTNRSLREKTDLAEKSSQAKSLFIANMSHELRTPLNSIIGFSKRVMSSDEQYSDRVEKSLEVINRSGKYLLSLVNDILDLAKIDSGKYELNRSKVDLALFAKEVCEEHKTEVKEKGLTLDQSHLPKTILYTDPLRFKQILTNLLSNAIKYTSAGKVSVSLKSFANHVSLEVTDTGIGIKNEDMARLFKRFEQFDEHSLMKIGLGTGLGLAITMELVTLLGGEISVDSEYGKGSHFRVKLPIVE